MSADNPIPADNGQRGYPIDSTNQQGGDSSSADAVLAALYINAWEAVYIRNTLADVEIDNLIAVAIVNKKSYQGP